MKKRDLLLLTLFTIFLMGGVWMPQCWARTLAFAGFGYEINPKYMYEDGQEGEYGIDIRYPNLISRREGAGRFNYEIKMILMQVMNEFKDGGFEKGTSQKSTLDVDYEIKHSGNDIVSILFDITIYRAGAAHSNQYALVLNYSLTRAKVLELPYLFWPDSKYLEFISMICYESLKNCECVLEGELKTHTAPLVENFKNWNFVKEGLQITFDPYQVACYAAGPQTVTIPYSKLTKILKPQYSLNFTREIETDRRLKKKKYY